VKAAAKKATARGAAMIEEERGLNVTIGKGTDDTMEAVDPSTTSTHLKWSRMTEQTGSWKKSKAYKLDGEPITLTDCDLCDINDTVHEVTREVLQEAMMEHQTVLGAFMIQLQEL